MSRIFPQTSKQKGMPCNLTSPALAKRLYAERGQPARLSNALLEQTLQWLEGHITACAQDERAQAQAALAELRELAADIRTVLAQRLPTPPASPAPLGASALPSVSRVPAVCSLCTERYLDLNGRQLDRYTTLSAQELRQLTPAQRRTLRQSAQQSLRHCTQCLAGCGSECSAELVRRAQHRKTIDSLTLDRL